MPKKTIDRLISQIHEAYGDNEPSPQGAQLMRDMQKHAGQADAGSDLQATANALLAELEADHPQAVAVARKVIETLGNIGV